MEWGWETKRFAGEVFVCIFSGGVHGYPIAYAWSTCSLVITSCRNKNVIIFEPCIVRSIVF